ncbi:hypothetical protein F0U44_13300 [Nocardioides humilatus]|uniref:WD40 repeat domain-containing protein n=1 Tax=Nocardioides humilatus TaxID=2607660 RepID=A0A5B1LG52_9ACTN|nr:hypothetical protein F0U44_13300 [Nocardioides humilatus]
MEKLLSVLALLPFGIGLTVSGDVAPPDRVVFSFQDAEIIESSGLVVEDGLFATINDSGDSGRVFTVNLRGETVAVTSWDGEPTDVESIAPLPSGDLLVGDIGDNEEARDSVQLLKVPFGQDGPVAPFTYDVAYPDGAHDAEALLVHPVTGQVLIVDKDIIGRMYAAPARLDPDGTNELTVRGDDLLPIATDGAFFPDGKHFILRGYFTAAVYRWPSLREVARMDLPAQEQGEGIAVDDRDRVFLSSEGQHSDVLSFALPKKVQAEVSGTKRPDRDGEPGTSARDDVVDQDGTRPYWPWALGGVVGVVLLLVLGRSLRPRR